MLKVEITFPEVQKGDVLLFGVSTQVCVDRTVAYDPEGILAGAIYGVGTEVHWVGRKQVIRLIHRSLTEEQRDDLLAEIGNKAGQVHQFIHYLFDQRVTGTDEGDLLELQAEITEAMDALRDLQDAYDLSKPLEPHAPDK